MYSNQTPHLFLPVREQNIILVYCAEALPRAEKKCWFTALEFVRSVLAVFLAVAQPHAGDAVPAWTGKVAFVALLPVGNWERTTKQSQSSGRQR